MDKPGWASARLGRPHKVTAETFNVRDASLWGLALRRTRSSPRQRQDHIAVTLARSPQHLEFRKKIRRTPNLDAPVRSPLRLSGDASEGNESAMIWKASAEMAIGGNPRRTPGKRPPNA
jgi:hypothetical protein